MLVEEPQGEPEHVLEVEPAHRALATLVPVVDPQHQLRRDRRVVVAELGEVPSRRDHPVLGPLDLAGELAPGQELVRRRQRVRERGDQRRLVVQHLGERLARVRGPEARELRERGRVERPRLDAVDVERSETPLQLTGGLVGERDREDLRRVERAAPNLARDAMRDRGGLARPCAGQDGDRSAEREGGFTLGIVQSGENALELLGHGSQYRCSRAVLRAGGFVLGVTVAAVTAQRSGPTRLRGPQFYRSRSTHPAGAPVGWVARGLGLGRFVDAHPTRHRCVPQTPEGL